MQQHQEEDEEAPQQPQGTTMTRSSWKTAAVLEESSLWILRNWPFLPAITPAPAGDADSACRCGQRSSEMEKMDPRAQGPRPAAPRRLQSPAAAVVAAAQGG